jgi:hypothetical protein
MVDPGEIKTLLVAASAISAEVIPALDAPDAPPELKKIATMMLSFMALMEAVVEKGVVPLAAAAANLNSGGGGALGVAMPPLPGASSTPPPRPNLRFLVAVNWSKLLKSRTESLSSSMLT